MAAAEPPPPPPAPRRLAIAGLHHVTLIASDLERTTAFYRDLLGLRLVKRTVNHDDPGARHFYFGDAEGAPGTVITFFEYPSMEPGRVGVGATHHVALRVATDEELEGWRAWLGSQGVQCTEVVDRTYFRSIYLRDPDGHILELATPGPGFAVDEPLDQLGTTDVRPR